MPVFDILTALGSRSSTCGCTGVARQRRAHVGYGADGCLVGFTESRNVLNVQAGGMEHGRGAESAEGANNLDGWGALIACEHTSGLTLARSLKSMRCHLQCDTILPVQVLVWFLRLALWLSL